MKKLCMVPLVALLSLVPIFAQAGDTALADFSSAFDAYRRGDYPRAGDSFVRISQDWPEDELAPESLFMASQSYFSAGDFSTAYSLSESFLQQYPQHSRAADVEYQRGRIAFKTGRFASAVELFDQFLARYPEHPLFTSALFWKAESYYQMGNFVDSLPLFNEIVLKWPDSEKASLAQWRLNVMGLESREAKLIRLAAYELQTQGAMDLYQYQRDAVREHQYLVWYTAYLRSRTTSHTASLSQADTELIASNQRLSLLLDAKQKALNLLIARIQEFLKGLSR